MVKEDSSIIADVDLLMMRCVQIKDVLKSDDTGLPTLCVISLYKPLTVLSTDGTDTVTLSSILLKAPFNVTYG